MTRAACLARTTRGAYHVGAASYVGLPPFSLEFHCRNAELFEFERSDFLKIYHHLAFDVLPRVQPIIDCTRLHSFIISV